LPIFSIRLVRSVFRRGHLGPVLAAHPGSRHRAGGIQSRHPGTSRARPAPPDEGARREVTLAELDEQLARIERLLTAIHPGSSPGAIDSD